MTRGITFLMVFIGIALVLQFVGPDRGTENSISTKMLDNFGVNATGSPDEFSQSSYFLQVIAILGLIGAAVIGVGLTLGFRDVTTYIIAAYTVVLIELVYNFISLIIYIQGTSEGMTWMSWFIVAIMFPITVGYVQEMISWWSGK